MKEKKIRPLEGSFKLPFLELPALVSRLPSFGSWSPVGGRGEEGGVRREKNENSPSQGELSGGVRALGAGRTGLIGSQGRPEAPGAARGRPGAKTEKGGLEKGGIVSVCLRGGRG